MAGVRGINMGHCDYSAGECQEWPQTRRKTGQKGFSEARMRGFQEERGKSTDSNVLIGIM